MTEVEKILKGLYMVGYVACATQDSKNNLIDVERAKLQLKKLVESKLENIKDGNYSKNDTIDYCKDEVTRMFE